MLKYSWFIIDSIINIRIIQKHSFIFTCWTRSPRIRRQGDSCWAAPLRSSGPGPGHPAAAAPCTTIYCSHSHAFFYQVLIRYIYALYCSFTSFRDDNLSKSPYFGVLIFSAVVVARLSAGCSSAALNLLLAPGCGLAPPPSWRLLRPGCCCCWPSY